MGARRLAEAHGYWEDLLSWLTSTSTTYPSTYQGLHQVVERVCKTVGNGPARRIAEVVQVGRVEDGRGSLGPMANAGRTAIMRPE